MKFIRHYFHEIYSVITLLFITASAIFVMPDDIQKLALVYSALFLLHEWEENNYPGGFFDMLFGEAIGIDPPPSGERLRNARVYVYLLLLVFTSLAYFGHDYPWLILPFVYLGILEGCAHNLVPRVFRLSKKYLPGVVTAVCQFCLSVFTLYCLISNGQVQGWQYAVGFVIFIACFFMMGRFGMAENGIDFKEVPQMALKSLKAHRGGK